MHLVFALAKLMANVSAYGPVLLERKAKIVKQNMGLEEGSTLQVRAKSGADRQWAFGSWTSIWLIVNFILHSWKAIITKALVRPFRLFFSEPIAQLLGVYMAFIYGLLYCKFLLELAMNIAWNCMPSIPDYDWWNIRGYLPSGQWYCWTSLYFSWYWDRLRLHSMREDFRSNLYILSEKERRKGETRIPTTYVTGPIFPPLSSNWYLWDPHSPYVPRDHFTSNWVVHHRMDGT